jgi:hypothetical protein
MAVPGLRVRSRAERREPAGRLEHVEVGPADSGQVAALAVLPERPPRPRGGGGGPLAVVIGQPERVAGEPAGRPGALLPPGDGGVKDRPGPGQRPGPGDEAGDPGDHPGLAEPVAVVVRVGVVLQIDDQRQCALAALVAGGSDGEAGGGGAARAVRVGERVGEHGQSGPGRRPGVGQVVRVGVVGVFRGLDRDERDAVAGQFAPVDRAVRVLVGGDVNPALGTAAGLRRSRREGRGRGQRDRHRHGPGDRSAPGPAPIPARPAALNSYFPQLIHVRRVIIKARRLQAETPTTRRRTVPANFSESAGTVRDNGI